jgi:hypothetical protein
MMKAMKRLTTYALGLFALLGGLPNVATAQIAYVPDVGYVPTGVTMTVTPVVSADRRYVRLGVNAFFNDLNGFTTLSFPGGAVGGGNFGGGGVAGINAGMNGVIGDEYYESGTQVGNGMNADPRALGAQPDMMRPGPLPGDQGLGRGDPFPARAGEGQGGEFGFMPGFDADEAALMMAMENGPQRRVRSTAGSLSRSARRSSRKTTKPPRRQNSSAQRKTR